jgi:hypothetical protein
MTKIRTVIPPNSKPGRSVIQVVHPNTGRPVRIRVPKDAKPGSSIAPASESDSNVAHVSVDQRTDTPVPDQQRNDTLATGVGSSPSIRSTTQSPVSKTQLESAESFEPATAKLDIPPKSSYAIDPVDPPAQTTETPVENAVYYAPSVPPVVATQPIYVAQQAVIQPAAVVYTPQPVVFQPPPNVVVVSNEKKTTDDRDCCAALCAACACTWLLAMITSRS